MSVDSSQFDPAQFLDATTTEASVRRPPLPAGLDVLGQISDIVFRKVPGVKDPSKTYTFMDVHIKVQVPPDLQADGQPPEVSFTDGVSIDLTANGTGFDMSPGKNGKLRRYRESLDMNTPGIPFSPRNMIGKMLKVKIKHDPYQGEMYDRVDTIAKA